MSKIPSKRAANKEPDDGEPKKAKIVSLDSLTDGRILHFGVGPRFMRGLNIPTAKLLWENPNLVDFEIVCRERTWKCHRSILYLASPFFRRLLDSGFREVHEGRLDLPEEQPMVVHMALEFMYTGHFNHQSDLGPLTGLMKLYKLADYLQMDELLERMPLILGLTYQSFYQGNTVSAGLQTMAPLAITFHLLPIEERMASARPQTRIHLTCKRCTKSPKEGSHSSGRCAIGQAFPADFSEAIMNLLEVPENEHSSKMVRLMARIGAQVWKHNNEHGIESDSFEMWVKRLNAAAKSREFAEIMAGMGMEDIRTSRHLASLVDGQYHLPLC